MGLLAEGKSRKRIHKDPNNTKWTRDTTTFGQKILRAQGWQPGQYLGAKDASHSELHTAANASYIRVAMKDDMKGLGFTKSKEDEVTGLDVFQDLLSRLNGKTEEAIEEDQHARMAVKANYYVEQRWGPMRFVYGGLLVGDELKDTKKDKDDDDDSSSTDSEEQDADEDVEMKEEPAAKPSKKEKKSKKRKASDDDDEADASERESESKSKRRRKEERKSRKAEEEGDDSDEGKAKKKAKKEKKEKKEKKSKKDKSRLKDEDEDSDTKASKKDKKKEKKEKKDKKRKKGAEASGSGATTTLESTPALSAPGTGTSTPTGTGTSTPQASRNFVRSRFIAQKRQAVLDTKALNQIFMVKA